MSIGIDYYQAIFYCVDPQSGEVVLSSDNVKEASYTRQHGVSPSSINVKLVPEADFSTQEMTAIFEDTEGTQLVIPYCKVDTAILQSGPSGIYLQLSILDRRWKWKFGQVSQKANLYNPNRTLIPKTKATPLYLANLCLEAMGEADADVSQLDTLTGQVWPTVEWDYANAAQSLEELVEELGYHVVYSMTDQVKICLLGDGQDLPTSQDNEDATADSGTLDPPETPEAIAAVGAYMEIQYDFKLRAVCLNTDGNVDPLDDASYIPYNDGTGWENSDLENYSDLSELTPANIELAKTSAYKWYQIDPEQTIKIPNPWYNPGTSDNDAMGEDPDMQDNPEGQWITLESIDQILPLLNTQITCVDQSLFGSESEVENFRLPPWVYGMFYLGKLDSFNDVFINNVPTFQAMGPSLMYANDQRRYTDPFSVDTRLGIVKFSKPVFAIDTDDTTHGQKRMPAQLALRISFRLKSPDTYVEQRHQYAQPTGVTYTTPTQYQTHEDLKRLIITNYTDGSSTLTPKDTTDNLNDVNNQAQGYINTLLAAYADTQPQTEEYRGLQPIDLDGAIRQVSWSISDSSPSKTTASRNTDSHPIAIPYEQASWERRVSNLLKKNDLRQIDAELRARRANQDDN